MKWATACDTCRREQRKKCDGLMPCRNCKQTKTPCTFSSFVTRYKKVDLYQLQTKLYNVSTRRRYYDAYTEGFFAPAILFNTTRLSTTSFDSPTTQPILLQYNTILASATRALGAPPHVYEIFENQARALAKELLTDFTHDTALGLHMLSMHYWGSNTDLGEHYRDLTLSTCNRALARPQNKIDAAKLVALNLVTLGLLDTDRGQPNLLQHNQKQIEKALQHSGLAVESLGVDDFINFSHFHVLLSNNLLGDTEGQAHYFTELEENRYNRFSETLKGVIDKLRRERSSTSSTLLLARALDEFLMGLAEYLKDPDSHLTHFENGVRIFIENEYLIGLSGPRFIAIFHAACKVSYYAKKYILAKQLVDIQQKEAEFFPAARKGAEENLEMLKAIPSEFSIEEIEEASSPPIPPSFVPVPTVNTTDTDSDPFGSSIHMFNLPVMRQ